MKNRDINLISIGDAAIIPAGRQSKIKEPSVTFKFRLGLPKNFFSIFKNVLNHSKFLKPLKVEGLINVCAHASCKKTGERLSGRGLT